MKTRHTRRLSRRRYTGAGEQDVALAVKLLSSPNSSVDTIGAAFLKAVRAGQLDVIKLFIADERTDLNTTNEDDTFALFIAASRGNTGIVKVLLADSRIDVNKTNSDGNSAFSIAAFKGHLPVVQLLLDDERTDVNKANKIGMTALAMAVEVNYINIVNVLLRDRRFDINTMNNHNETPLYIAASNGYIEIVKLLLAKEDIDVNKSVGGMTPLRAAVEHGSADIVSMFIGHPGTDVNIAAANNTTPLFIAASNGNDAVVKLLLDYARTDINAPRSDGMTPFNIAVFQGNYYTVKVFLDNGRADFNMTRLATGMTAPHIAAYYGDVDVMGLLLKDERIDVTRKDAEGMTALHIAVGAGYDEVVQMLLADGRFDVNEETLDGRSPLYIAAEREHANIVELLLADRRVTISKRVIDAALNDIFTEEIAEILIPPGAAPLKMWKGFTRSDIAIMDTIFETEGGPGVKAPALNWSACPVCLKYAERSDACKYMKHNCRKEGGYYNKTLYEKYQDDGGLIEWCTICGRISSHHRHYALASHDDVEYKMAKVEPGADVFSDDCILEGGGGLEEKILRFRRLREHARLLNRHINEISQKDAYDSLVVETWDAPLISRKVGDVIARGIAKQKKWNIPIENFPPNVVPVATDAAAAEAAVNAPNVTRSAENIRDLRPVVLEQGEDALLGGDGPFIQFNHRLEDGTINNHTGSLIGKDSLGVFIEYVTKNFSEKEFGHCWQYPICSARLYPDEIKEFVSADLYEDYRKKFNRKFLA
jgi:ankyrin repeat protein